jgi:hypothetical protein
MIRKRIQVLDYRSGTSLQKKVSCQELMTYIGFGLFGLLGLLMIMWLIYIHFFFRLDVAG